MKQNQESQHSQVQETLAEQMRITERDIAYRKYLLDFTDDDVGFLLQMKEPMSAAAEELVEEYYTSLTANPEVKLVIGDSETLERLKQAMRRYVVELFSGFYDLEYVNKRLRIGRVHKRIGVAARLYLSAVNLLESLICQQIATFPESPAGSKLCQDRTHALHKLMLFDMQLVFDTYISSLEAEVVSARQDLERHARAAEENFNARTQRLQQLSTHDSLTGLLNQQAFFEALHREILVAERNAWPMALIFLDLNGFKAVNDTHGHLEGDRILKQVGNAICETFREVDYCVRYGGDEFAIVMPKALCEQACEACRRLIMRFEDAGNTRGISFSIGIMQTGPAEFHDSETLVRNADALMYRAKEKAHATPDHYVEC
ncbi:MAG: GGDEF domain-containing protein [Rhodospirillales bacterium]|nr:GGDEF domain-containing protein [Alphaproteobacteria bacterium]MCB9987323.1 GGDEF domain-containing protein [Rhodospirillales bacterium]USO07822.1 MAG: GGDEF domain-containing protein [Rhodospirillales bacterium]